MILSAWCRMLLLRRRLLLHELRRAATRRRARGGSSLHLPKLHQRFALFPNEGQRRPATRAELFNPVNECSSCELVKTTISSHQPVVTPTAFNCKLKQLLGLGDNRAWRTRRAPCEP